MQKTRIKNSAANYPLCAIWILSFLCFFGFSYMIFCFAQEYNEDRQKIRVKEELREFKKDLVYDDTTKDPFVGKAFATEMPKRQEVAIEKEPAELPIELSGDKIEYATDSRDVTIIGDAVVTYKGSTLTCQRLTINTATKSGVAEGDVRLDEKEGVIEGDKLIYNFETSSGTIINANFRSTPYYCKAGKLEKVSQDEFENRRGYLTTCNMDHPHYRIGVRQLNFFPKNKLIAKGATFYIGGVPVLFLPKYEHSFRDPLAPVQVMPGNRKQWGQYLLTAWRFDMTENVSGRIYLDVRQKLGIAEGFGANYQGKFGKGDFKFYYTHEKDTTMPAAAPNNEFERYLIRLRHKWDIDPNTYMTGEYYKIRDSKMANLGPNYNFLKDYFYREYEKDEQPLTYWTLHRSFGFSSFDFTVQPRVNSWYSNYLEKLPEAKFSLPSTQIGDSRFYIENRTSGVNYNLKSTSTMTPATNEFTPDTHYNRLDMYNKLSYATKVSFIEFTPYVASEETWYSKDIDGKSIAPRTVFFSGADMSTKFYRLYDIKTNFIGMDLNGLRHIITPTVKYAFNHEPTIPNSRLRQIDPGIDSMVRNNSVSLELSNKLQTKRNNIKTDILDLRVNSIYYLKPKYSVKRGSNFSDILLNLNFYPTNWFSIIANSIYNRSVARTDDNYNKFTNVNYDLNFALGNKGALGFGQRYARKAGNQLTSSFSWKLSPKWKFSIYERYEMGNDPNVKRGLKEQQYTLSRDLHCWQMDVAYDITQAQGHTIWFVFRLKAFPEMEFNFDQSYHQPRPGSQVNP
jgi:LPS-assembly protein